jgi:hypothetical protein
MLPGPYNTGAGVSVGESVGVAVPVGVLVSVGKLVGASVGGREAVALGSLIGGWVGVGVSVLQATRSRLANKPSRMRLYIGTSG